MKKPDDPLFLVWLGGLGVSVYLAALPLDLRAQLWGATVFWGGLLVLRSYTQGVGRVLFLFLGAFLSLRYFLWRTTSTLSYHDVPSFAAGMALYLAETYGIIMHLLGIFVNIHPLHRQPVPLPPDPQQWPTVDVLIPSYNEAPELLGTTLLAAMQIRYPRNKIAVYLLDDGGTAEKCNAADSVRAADAQQRCATLQALCRRIGAQYLTREKNEHAKAGNLNAALRQTHGELVLILDADHVPTVDILENTVGWFVRDPQMFLVQTPHFFINPNPVEKNLQTFEHMPGDNEMFYSVVQPGLDFWNASFFCGAAGVLRRRYLDEVGGICGSTITEDAETALALHARGYRSAYLSRPMIAGLSPETFSSFIIQRTRWAQGMTQILLLQNPLLLKGLALQQRLGYLNSSFFWLFPYARLVFLLAPSAYLLCGWKIYDATVAQGIAYILPHLISVLLVADYLFGKVRWTLVSELYELMQSIFCLRAINKVFLRPRAPTFLVTPKGEQLDHTFISPLAGPFYLLLAAVVVSLGAGVQRYFSFPAERLMILATLGWEALNLVLVLAALGALLEQRQRRRSSRIPVDEPADLLIAPAAASTDSAIDTYVIPCILRDVSAGGARLTASSQYATVLQDVGQARLQVDNKSLGKRSTFTVALRNTSAARPGTLDLGVEFTHAAAEERAEKVAFVHGDSARWQRFLQRRAKHIGVWRGMIFLLQLGTYSLQHLWALLRLASQALAGHAARMRRSILTPAPTVSRTRSHTPLRRAA